MASQNTFVISTGDKPTLEFEFDDVITDHVTDGISGVVGTPVIEGGDSTCVALAVATVEGGGGVGKLSIFWRLGNFAAGHWYIDMKIKTVLSGVGTENEYQRRFFVNALPEL